MSLVVLSPHLDDAVLSCWHLLEGSEVVTVVNVFTGSPTPGMRPPRWDRATGAHDPVARMRQRREEDRRALGLVGRAAVNLGLLDAQYGRIQSPVGPLLARLQRWRDPATVLYAPVALSRHPDHELVRDVALDLARAGWRVVLYADLPHGIRHGWPVWVAGRPEPAGRNVSGAWNSVLEEAGLPIDELSPRVWPLTESARRRKLRALEEYRTQRAALDALAFAPLGDARALAFEVSWALPQQNGFARAVRSSETVTAADHRHGGWQ